jgi:hypothetical protein
MFSTLAQQQKGLQAIPLQTCALRHTSNLINWQLPAGQMTQMFKILLTLLVWHRQTKSWIGMVAAISAILLPVPLE